MQQILYELEFLLEMFAMPRSQPGKHCMELPFSRHASAVCVLQAVAPGGSHLTIQQAYTMSFQQNAHDYVPGID